MSNLQSNQRVTRRTKLQFNYCGVCGEIVTYEKHGSIFSNKLMKGNKDEPDVWQRYHYECVPLLTERRNGHT